MKIYLDTANVDEIREAASWGVLSGVTTNPSLVAKEGREYREVIREIAEIVKGHISVETITMTADEMIEEGRELAKWARGAVVKIPMCREGLKAIHGLASEGISVNTTLIFSPNQALLAARAGAKYVSPFVGRLDDISHDGTELIADIVEIFETHDIATEVLAASIRHPVHVIQVARQGAHIATMPFKVLQQMCDHPLTTAGIEKFRQDYEKIPKSTAGKQAKSKKR
ncbi:MAG: fructose-6-phosphate aldolase [Candidatus Wallbacteria bacterium]|nr:fructose-6-phosphate aldolase [Candidatus Wallbacteria bacterium]